MTYKMNQLPDGFEDLPIGFIQALFDFYRVIEKEQYHELTDLSIKEIDPIMRAPIIQGHYFVREIAPEPLKSSDVFELGTKLGLHPHKVMNIIAGKYDGKR